MRETIFVISDLHLGGSPGEGDDPSFQMCSPAGQAVLAAFIHYVAGHQESGRDVRLVLAGDVVDFLAEKEFTPFTEQDEPARQKLERIILRTSQVWSSLSTFAASGGRLTVLLGNHDIELSLPGPRRLLMDHLGPGRIEFIYDNQAFADGQVLIEHGNRYDSWNIVSHDRLREHRSALSRGEVPPRFEGPAGSHLVVKVMNAIKREYPFVDLLKPEDAGLLPFLAVLHPPSVKEIQKLIPLWRKQSQVDFNAEGIPTDLANIAAPAVSKDEEMIKLAFELGAGGDPANVGFMDTARSVLELLRLARSKEDREVQQHRLYRALRARAERTWEAFDVGKEAEDYIRPARAAAGRGFKVIVFGHTHLVKRVPLGGEGAVYLNTGTWADLMAVPDIVLSGEADRGMSALEQFTADLEANRLEKYRRQVPTFARIEVDSGVVTEADVHFFEGGERVARVPEGRLEKLSC